MRVLHVGSRGDLRADIRRFVTRRCSGYSSGEECKFSLLLDVVESEVWGGGLVTILHSCLHTTNIRQDCQHDVDQLALVNTTVLMSPSYPKYYLSVSGRVDHSRLQTPEVTDSDGGL